MFQSPIQSNPQTALWFVCLIKLFPIPWQLGTKHLDLSLRESEGLKISSGRLDDLCMHVCYVTSVTSDSLWPMDCSPPSSSVHGILQERILEWLISLLQEIFPPGIEPTSLMSPALAGKIFTTEPPGKPLDGLQVFKTPANHPYIHPSNNPRETPCWLEHILTNRMQTCR